MNSPLRLLVVDDHEVLRQGLRFMLHSETDIQIVAEADDGLEALDRLEKELPDVVLLDLQMAGMGGLETLGQIRQRWKELPVLVFSIHSDPEYVEEALQLGAQGYLLKSVGKEELVRAIRAVSDGAGYLQAEITRPVLQRFTRLSLGPMLEVQLSPREEEVLVLIADGLSNKQIARSLDLSELTVKTYVKNLFEKLGATHRAHAVALALRNRLID